MFSFRARKKVVDIAPHIRRIIDITTPDFLRTDELRHDRRYLRSISLAICPWSKKGPDIDGLMFGVSKDISDLGFGVYTAKPIPDGDLAVGVLVHDVEQDHVPFFKGTVVRELRRFEFYETGLSVSEYLNEDFGRQIAALVDAIYAEPALMDTSTERETVEV